MEATFQIETDIRIPDHLYNEAVELLQIPAILTTPFQFKVST
jgi:hypothetical protein